MADPCNPNDCPLTPRVDALERANEQHSKTHREMFDRVRALETSDAVQNANYKAIDAKLDELTIMVKELSGKPAKLWETLIACVISALGSAFVMWLTMGMPGVGK